MEKANELLKRYRAGQCTEEEKAALENWFHHLDKDVQYSFSADEFENLSKEMWGVIDSAAPEIRKVSLWPRIAVAAAAVTAIAIGVYFYTSRHLEGSAATRDLLKYANNDIAPGKNSATLTLANGKKILINNAASGQLAEQHGVSISKTADGQIIYELKDKGNAGGYNTLQTSKGEQTQVRLQDGSVVKLNAASILTYPASFAHLKERRVKLQGEGYFTVSHNAKQPFRVESKGQVVEDIGTEFNINAYGDEAVVRTTLVEGAARVFSLSSRANAKDLNPNQQAILSADNQIIVKKVDVEEAIAWKKGYFKFNAETLSSIMNKVARWYDVEVIYSDKALAAVLFSGTVSRFENISVLLEKLELTAPVKFKIEGRKVYVMK